MKLSGRRLVPLLLVALGIGLASVGFLLFSAVSAARNTPPVSATAAPQSPATAHDQ